MIMMIDYDDDDDDDGRFRPFFRIHAFALASSLTLSEIPRLTYAPDLHSFKHGLRAPSSRIGRRLLTLFSAREKERKKEIERKK